MNHISKIRGLFDAADIDAILLTSPVSQRYAVGYAFSDGYVLITGSAAYLVTDFRYLEEAEKLTDPEITVVAPSSMLEFIEGTLIGDGAGRIGYEDRALTCADFARIFEDLPGVAVPIGGGIEDLRAVKDSSEIAMIRMAQSITDAAYQHILKTLTPSMTEVDVVLELEFFMRRAGAEGIAFPTIAVSGASSALPHGLPSRNTLSRGFLTMDFGAMYGGYCSDMTRTVSLGKATQEMKRLYETVRHAQELGIEAIAAGIEGHLVDGAARSFIDSQGYAGLFGHSFGHGVGLEIHEAPRLSSRSSIPLAAGNVVTAEPGIYRIGEYGCRIENMGLVTEDGFENFTASSTELLELF